MLQAGDLVPHFSVTTLDGEHLSYSDIWQRRNLLLVSLGHAEPIGSTTYVSQLTARIAELTAHDTECVITPDGVSGLPCPGVIVADRWGEICYVAHVARVADLPGPRDLIEWLDYVQSKCPECEGEAR